MPSLYFNSLHVNLLLYITHPPDHSQLSSMANFHRHVTQNFCTQVQYNSPRTKKGDALIGNQRHKLPKFKIPSLSYSTIHSCITGVRTDPATDSGPHPVRCRSNQCRSIFLIGTGPTVPVFSVRGTFPLMLACRYQCGWLLYMLNLISA